MSWRMRQVDFQHPRRAPRTGWWCLAVGAALCVGSLVAYRAAQQEVTSRAAQAAQVARQAKAATVPVRAPAFATDVRWRVASQELTFPWDARLQALETATTPPVYLLSLNPDKRSGTVRLEAEVAEYADALDYVDRLASSGNLGRPTLQSHEMVQDPSGRPYMRVVITAPWTGRAP